MKMLLKGLGALVALFVLFIIGVVVFAKAKGNPTFTFPKTGLVASTDPAVIAEGEYLFHGPMHCTACHDTGKDVAFTRKAQEKIEPLGGMSWDMGPMGRLVSANLTSDKETGLGNKSDEHIAQVLKHGVGEDGKLRMFMALAVAGVNDREIIALLSYLRTLPAKQHVVEPEQSGVLGELFVAMGTIGPKKFPAADFVAAGEAPTIERGAYLANGPGLCVGCHSPYDFLNGLELKGEKFSGCFEAEPGHDDTTIEVCAPNLTSHPKAGHITAWTEEQFVARFRGGAYTHKESPMPWTNFSNMTESDLRSIFMFLRSVPASARESGPPIRNVGVYKMPKT